MKVITKENFRSMNGDKLAPLNTEKAIAWRRLDAARTKLKKAEAELEPLRQEVEQAEAQIMNLSCRLNIWWKAFRGAIEPNRRRDIMTMPEGFE